MDKKYKVFIVNSPETYHPKVYYFYNNTDCAIIIGSSNFTYSGFSKNIESNVILEGIENKKIIEVFIKNLTKTIDSLPKIIPDAIWLKAYRLKYEKRQKHFQVNNFKDEASNEDALANNDSWLGTASFDIYLSKISEGLINFQKQHNISFDSKVKLFEEYKKTLPVPWTPIIFNDLQNRRRLGGIKPNYGWLGHIAASGQVRHLFANGTKVEKSLICNAINNIAALELPVNFGMLKKELNKLVALGPTIKAWGRLLAITRPDLYCTISAPSVRENLSILLEKPKTYFTTVDGYIDLIKLIHASPWFNTPAPKDKMHYEIWKRRVTFLDVYFY